MVGNVITGVYNGKPRVGQVIEVKGGDNPLLIVKTGHILPNGKDEIKSFYLSKFTEFKVMEAVKPENKIPQGWDHL